MIALVPSMSRVKYGIAGWGTSAKVFHVPLIEAAGGTVAAVVERRAATAKDLLGDACTVCRSVDELVSLPHIDVIVIATPSGLHFEHAKLALEGGKHVIVEKPFAPTFHQAQELCDLARAVSLHSVSLICAARRMRRVLTPSPSPAQSHADGVPKPALGR